MYLYCVPVLYSCTSPFPPTWWLFMFPLECKTLVKWVYIVVSDTLQEVVLNSNLVLCSSLLYTLAIHIVAPQNHTVPPLHLHCWLSQETSKRTYKACKKLCIGWQTYSMSCVRDYMAAFNALTRVAVFHHFSCTDFWGGSMQTIVQLGNWSVCWTTSKTHWFYKYILKA